jgi:transposase
MTDILQLPGWEVTGIRLDGEYIIEAAYTAKADACVKCGVIGNLYRHGTKKLRYRDSPIRGNPVVLEGIIQRYRCKECGETFVQAPDGIDDTRRMTTRCIEYIQEQSIRDTFTHVAEHVGCTEGTVRNIAGEHFKDFDDGFKPYLPEWMGMDETKLDGSMRGIIADVRNRRPIDILRDREKPTIIKWLSQFKQKDTVKGLAIDMWRPYKDAAQLVFPGLPVVVDKFHLVRMGNYSVESVRKASQKDKTKAERIHYKRSRLLLLKRYKKTTDKQRFNLDMWLDNEPELAEAYWLKERLYDIYDMPKAEAIAAYDAFPGSIPAGMKKHFGDLTRAMRNWRTEVLAYFDHPITNGYTESLNGTIKVINRNARGYGFDVLRAKILGRKYPIKTTVKKIAPLPGFARAYTGPAAEGHKILIEALGNRCESCQGVFDTVELESHHMRPVVEGERDRFVYLCPSCHRRFHTQEASHRNQHSTQNYE